MTTEYQLRLLPREAYNEQSIKEYLVRNKGLDPRRLTTVRVLRRSIDARQRTVIVNLTVCAYIDEQPTDTPFTMVNYPVVDDCPEVIVVGAGPGGLFAALRLIELGYRPIVVERGKDVRERKKDIARISREHVVNPESNYSFGEGGAGAYSDGKLFTRSKKRGSVEKILNVFCQHGASEAILSDAHPHIGTDKLPRVIENMRNTILRCGGEVHFQTRMTSLLIRENRVVGIEYERTIPAADDAASNVSEVVSGTFMADAVILATGHSARDVYRWLWNNGVEIEAKGIAVGVRLEHPAELIDRLQYHSRDGRGQWLPAAEYSYVTQVDGRGVYSFCMCPGGFVVPAASGPEQVVVNGMSPSSRSGRWSNSGMVVELHPEDVLAQLSNTSQPSSTSSSTQMSPLCMMEYQEQLEHQAWLAGGRRQTAPAQRMADFVNGRLSAELPESSYSPGLIAAPLHFVLPEFVSSRLRKGFLQFGKSSHGFLTNDATVIGVETRTSAPVRILRNNETLQHVRLSGLFPCGEGAGYAGGIVSAGVDGERCAESAALFLSALQAR